MEQNIQSRYLDMYNSILQNTLVNYHETNNMIRQVEFGVRQLMRYDFQYIN